MKVITCVTISSKRFEYLLEEIIKKNEDVKVLLLSATPINTDFKDVRNQLKLITKDNNGAFKEEMDINNLDYLFKQTSKHYNQWQQEKEASITELTQSFWTCISLNLRIALSWHVPAK